MAPTEPENSISVEDRLRDLSTRLVHSMNTRTFTAVATELLLPEYTGFHDMDQTPWRVSNREAIITQMNDFLAANPEFHTEILDLTVDVDEKRGRASVWIRRTDTGLSEGWKKETIMEFGWVEKDGRWWCGGYKGVRSFPFYGG